MFMQLLFGLKGSFQHTCRVLVPVDFLSFFVFLFISKFILIKFKLVMFKSVMFRSSLLFLAPGCYQAPSRFLASGADPVCRRYHDHHFPLLRHQYRLV